MTGGDGDDIYIVDNIGDTVTENSSEGTDIIYSSVTFTASNNVENLSLLDHLILMLQVIPWIILLKEILEITL